MNISNTSFNNIILDFDSKIDSQADLEKVVLVAYQKSKNFFGKNVPGIKISFLYQRSQIDKIRGYKTQDWEVAYAYGKENQIFIFSPIVFDKVSNHPKSDFEYILTHEIAHLFSNKILGFSYPKWFCEGLAGYVAEQYKIRPVGEIDNFSDLHDKVSWDKFNNYPQAFSFTEYLIENLGKERILKFLEDLGERFGCCPNFKDFNEFFEDFFNINFKKLVSAWQKTIISQN